jgi:hypothetical protein
LHALVTVHFAREEEVYVPLLEASLSPDQAAQMFSAMHAAATASRAEQGHAG